MADLNHALQQGKEFLENEDYEAALLSLIPCAEAGIVEAEAAIGVLHMLGQGTQRDLQKAIYYLKRAASRGSGIAAHNLGTLFMTCEPDLPLDPDESRRWFALAADLGFVPGGNLK